jgi:hypothetical protein
MGVEAPVQRPQVKDWTQLKQREEKKTEECKKVQTKEKKEEMELTRRSSSGEGRGKKSKKSKKSQRAVLAVRQQREDVQASWGSYKWCQKEDKVSSSLRRKKGSREKTYLHHPEINSLFPCLVSMYLGFSSFLQGNWGNDALGT